MKIERYAAFVWAAQSWRDYKFYVAVRPNCFFKVLNTLLHYDLFRNYFLFFAFSPSLT